jgi:hypothetical protein
MNACLAIALAVLMQQPIPKAVSPRLAPTPPSAMPPVAPPTAPTPIVLDFKAQTAPMIALTLNQRSGGIVEIQGMNAPIGNEQRFTIESPAPVPFWEAIDRFSAETHYQRSITAPGTFGNPNAKVQFHGPGAPGLDYGPAAYVGPFRLGPVVIHENFDLVFLKPKQPANWIVETSPTFYAEFPLLSELNLISTRLGPLRKLEAIDELGQSLLDSKLGGEGSPLGLLYQNYQNPKTIQLTLVRPAKPSTKLATLRGVIPLEVGRRPNAPTAVFPLEGSTGKTFSDGDIRITVREFSAAPGRAQLKLTIRLEGPRGQPDAKLKGLLGSRLNALYHNLIDVADAQGKPVSMNGGGGASSNGVLTLDYNYAVYPPGSTGSPPTQLRVFRPEWVNWEMPFEFKDLILP